MGFEPRSDLESGMKELVGWGKMENAEDCFDKAEKELENKSLIKS
jgi:hypothetical protein